MLLPSGPKLLIPPARPLVLRLLIVDAGRHFNAACTRKKTKNFTAHVDADAKPPFADVSTQCHALDILNYGPLLGVPSVEEHERLIGQVRAYMDAVRPDIERIVNAFVLSVNFVNIEYTSRGISVGVVYQGYTTKERHSEFKRALVGFLEDHEMNKFCGSSLKTTSATSDDLCFARRGLLGGSNAVSFVVGLLHGGAPL